MTDAFITYGSEEEGKTGRAYVFYGDGSIPTTAGSADKTFTGEGAGDMFGFSVSNAGDVDNDGKDDVIIGAPFNDDAGTDAGEAYVFVGGDQYRYVSSNVTTYGYMTDFNDTKSASDSGAYATLKEEDTGGSGGNEYLYVDGLGTERQGWTESGSTPFLDAAEGTNVITTSTNNAEHGDFTFSDSSVSGAFSSSQIELYSYQEGSGETVEVFMYNGTSWQSMGTIAPDSSYSWKTLSTSSFLDSKAKIDAAKMYVRYGKSGGPDNVHVDAARIYWSAASETIYRMDIEFNTTNVPSGSNYYLELNYSVDGTETDFGVLVYDSSTWDDMTAQGDLDQTSFATKSYTLDTDHRLGSGYVRVRYIGRNETSDAANSTLNIEYHRIRISGVFITFAGETAGDNFGWSVANASDINEDGSYDDIIIGAPGYSSSTGRAYVFHGASSMDSTADVTLTGENGGDKFGFSVHGVGDIDLDSAPDVAIGAPYYDDGATTDAGIIYVYKGGSLMDATYDYFFKGTQANQHFGWSVGFALKLDGGSYNAILAGSPDYDDGSDTDAGEANAMVMIPEYSTVIIPLLVVIILFAFRRRRKDGKQA
jgi:hypothetical protein